MAKDKEKDKKSKSDREDDEHGSKAIDEQLDELEDDWADTEEKSFGDVPDGKYQAKITAATINNAKSESARLQASFEFTILNTEHRGRKLFTHFGIEDEEQRGFLRGALAKLGIEWPAKPKLLPGVLEEITNTFCALTARTRKKKDKDSGEYVERQNVYIDKALDSDDVEDLEVEDDEKDEKDEKDSKDDDKEEKSSKKSKEDREEKKDKSSKKDSKDDDEDDEDEDDEKDSKDDEKDDDEKEEKEEKSSKKEKGKEDKKDSKEEEGVVVEFEDDDLNKRMNGEIDELAKKYDFDTDDYKVRTDLLADIAEYVGLSGKFSKPMKLISAIQEAKPKK